MRIKLIKSINIFTEEDYNENYTHLIVKSLPKNTELDIVRTEEKYDRTMGYLEDGSYITLSYKGVNNYKIVTTKRKKVQN